jgi:sugar phosphate isomerase/epimerase
MEAAMAQFKVSFSTLACPEWPWAEIVRRGAAAGYDGVEVRLIQNETDLRKIPDLQPGVLDGRVAELKQARFAVCGLASSVRFDYPDAAQRAAQVRIGRDYIAMAARLGASFIRVFGDVLPPETEPDARQQTLRNIAAGLQELGEHADAHGIGILIETHGDFANSRLLADLMEMVHCQAVGVLWDTHHPWRFFGETLAATWDQIGRWVRHTHWKDSVLRPEHELDAAGIAADDKARNLMSGHRPADYVLFGGGGFPAVDCLRLLLANGYTGWFSLEWEKAWHPQIEGPDIALPLFPPKLREMAGLLAR